MNMAHTSRFSIGSLSVLDMLLIAFGVYWLCMLPALFSDVPVRPASTRVLLLPAVGIMYWATVQRMNQVRRATEVLGSLIAPRMLWQQLTAQGMQRVRLTWALLATGTTLQLALPGTDTEPITGAALMSLAGAIALLHSVARGGALPLAARTVDLALAVLALPLLLSWPQPLAWFAALPFGVLAGAAVAFPLLLTVLERRWRRQPPLYRWRAQQHKLSLTGSMLAHLRRYTVLMYNAQSDSLGWSSQRQTSNPVRLFFTVMPMLLAISASSLAISDGQFLVSRLVSWMLMAMFLASGLVVRDLHWRTFLMPGGLRKGRIGSSIFATTMLVQLVFLGVLTTLAALWIRLALGHDLDALLNIIRLNATVPLELAMVTSIAVAFRPLAKSPAWMVTFIAMVIIATGLLMDSSGGTGYVPLSFEGYVATLCGITLVLVLLSNRLWNMKRLFEISGLDKPA